MRQGEQGGQEALKKSTEQTQLNQGILDILKMTYGDAQSSGDQQILHKNGKNGRIFKYFGSSTIVEFLGYLGQINQSITSLIGNNNPHKTKVDEISDDMSKYVMQLKPEIAQDNLLFESFISNLVLKRGREMWIGGMHSKQHREQFGRDGHIVFDNEEVEKILQYGTTDLEAVGKAYSSQKHADIAQKKWYLAPQEQLNYYDIGYDESVKLVEDKEIYVKTICGHKTSQEDVYYATVVGADVCRPSDYLLEKIWYNALKKVQDKANLLTQYVGEYNNKKLYAPVESGAVYVGAIYYSDSTIQCINGGDSRSFVIVQKMQEAQLSNGQQVIVIPLTVDAKPTNVLEQARLNLAKENQHSAKKTFAVEDGRVNGIISVARAMGDPDLLPSSSCEYDPVQINLKEKLQKDYKVPVADFDKLKITLVSGCDGIFDVLDIEDIIALKLQYDKKVSQDVEWGKQHSFAQILVFYAYQKGSKDNLTAISCEVSHPSNKGKSIVQMVFDGHAGRTVAQFMEDAATEEVNKMMSNKAPLPQQNIAQVQKFDVILQQNAPSSQSTPMNYMASMMMVPTQQGLDKFSVVKALSNTEAMSEILALGNDVCVKLENLYNCVKSLHGQCAQPVIFECCNIVSYEKFSKAYYSKKIKTLPIIFKIDRSTITFTLYDAKRYTRAVRDGNTQQKSQFQQSMFALQQRVREDAKGQYGKVSPGFSYILTYNAQGNLEQALRKSVVIKSTKKHYEYGRDERVRSMFVEEAEKMRLIESKFNKDNTITTLSSSLPELIYDDNYDTLNARIVSTIQYRLQYTNTYVGDVRIIMPLGRGKEMTQIYNMHNELLVNANVAFQIGIKMLEKISSLHDQSCYEHNDLKEANLMYDVDPKGLADVTILDYGFAQNFGSRMRGWGTPLYMPPEVLAIMEFGEGRLGGQGLRCNKHYKDVYKQIVSQNKGNTYFTNGKHDIFSLGKMLFGSLFDDEISAYKGLLTSFLARITALEEIHKNEYTHLRSLLLCLKFDMLAPISQERITAATAFSRLNHIAQVAVKQQLLEKQYLPDEPLLNYEPAQATNIFVQTLGSYTQKNQQIEQVLQDIEQSCISAKKILKVDCSILDKILKVKDASVFLRDNSSKQLQNVQKLIADIVYSPNDYALFDFLQVNYQQSDSLLALLNPLLRLEEQKKMFHKIQIMLSNTQQELSYVLQNSIHIMSTKPNMLCVRAEELLSAMQNVQDLCLTYANVQREMQFISQSLSDICGDCTVLHRDCVKEYVDVSVIAALLRCRGIVEEKCPTFLQSLVHDIELMQHMRGKIGEALQVNLDFKHVMKFKKEIDGLMETIVYETSKDYKEFIVQDYNAQVLPLVERSKLYTTDALSMTHIIGLKEGKKEEFVHKAFVGSYKPHCTETPLPHLFTISLAETYKLHVDAAFFYLQSINLFPELGNRLTMGYHMAYRDDVVVSFQGGISCMKQMYDSVKMPFILPLQEECKKCITHTSYAVFSYATKQILVVDQSFEIAEERVDISKRMVRLFLEQNNQFKHEIESIKFQYGKFEFISQEKKLSYGTEICVPLFDKMKQIVEQQHGGEEEFFQFIEGESQLSTHDIAKIRFIHGKQLCGEKVKQYLSENKIDKMDIVKSAVQGKYGGYCQANCGEKMMLQSQLLWDEKANQGQRIIRFEEILKMHITGLADSGEKGGNRLNQLQHGLPLVHCIRDLNEVFGTIEELNKEYHGKFEFSVVPIEIATLRLCNVNQKQVKEDIKPITEMEYTFGLTGRSLRREIAQKLLSVKALDNNTPEVFLQLKAPIDNNSIVREQQLMQNVDQHDGRIFNININIVQPQGLSLVERMHAVFVGDVLQDIYDAVRDAAFDGGLETRKMIVVDFLQKVMLAVYGKKNNIPANIQQNLDKLAQHKGSLLKQSMINIMHKAKNLLSKNKDMGHDNDEKELFSPESLEEFYAVYNQHALSTYSMLKGWCAPAEALTPEFTNALDAVIKGNSELDEAYVVLYDALDTKDLGYGIIKGKFLPCGQYYMRGVDDFLSLRLGTSQTKVLPSMVVNSELGWELMLKSIIAHMEVYDSVATAILIPVIGGLKHWVGIVSENVKDIGKVRITYIDSENIAIPDILQHGIQQGVASGILFKQSLVAQQQRYANNCGLEAVANIALHLSQGRTTQENELILHSLLKENALLDSSIYWRKIEENRHVMKILTNRENIPSSLFKHHFEEQKNSLSIDAVSALKADNCGIEDERKGIGSSMLEGYPYLKHRLLHYLYGEDLSKIEAILGHQYVQESQVVGLKAILSKDPCTWGRRDFSILKVVIHPDKRGNREDFKMLLSFEEKLSKKNSLVEALSEKLSKKLHFVVDKTITCAKTIDVFVDVAKMYVKPDIKHARDMVFDSVLLYAKLQHTKMFFPAATAIASTSMVLNGQYLLAGMYVAQRIAPPKASIVFHVLPIAYAVYNEQYSLAAMQIMEMFCAYKAPSVVGVAYAMYHTTYNLYTLYQLYKGDHKLQLNTTKSDVNIEPAPKGVISSSLQSVLNITENTANTAAVGIEIALSVGIVMFWSPTSIVISGSSLLAMLNMCIWQVTNENIVDAFVASHIPYVSQKTATEISPYITHIAEGITAGFATGLAIQTTSLIVCGIAVSSVPTILASVTVGLLVELGTEVYNSWHEEGHTDQIFTQYEMNTNVMTDMVV